MGPANRKRFTFHVSRPPLTCSFVKLWDPWFLFLSWPLP
jgi:hypothetical protein